MEARAELLRKTDERLAHLYAMHSGREAEEFASLMAENNGEGRWLTAEETLQAGLADKIIDNVFVGSLVPEGEEVLPSDEVKPNVENSVAGEIIRYLLGRLAYRIEEWIERLHEKHLAKRQERLAEKQAEQDEQAEPVAEESLPQAEAKQPTRSTILFDEGQRRYTATQVKATEDPSMSTPHALSNERAYADDAKAFGRY